MAVPTCDNTFVLVLAAGDQSCGCKTVLQAALRLLHEASQKHPILCQALEATAAAVTCDSVSQVWVCQLQLQEDVALDDRVQP